MAVGLSAQTFNGSTTNTAGNSLIPSAGTGGCTVAPQTTTGTRFPLTVTGLAAGQQVSSVSLTATHTWANDLDIYLQSPTGQILALSTDNGGTTGLDVQGTLTFSIASTTPVTTWNGGPPMGPYTAEGGPVSACGGAPATTINTLDALTASNGVWNLIFYDDAGGDSGSLAAWSITFGAPPNCMITCPPAVTVSTDPGICGAVLSIPDAVVNADCFGTPVFDTISSGVQPLAGGTQLIATGFPITFPATPATGPVQICFDYVGDFGAAVEITALQNQAGTTILSTATGTDCQAQQVCVTITAATYNAQYAGTTQTFTLQPNAQVNPQLCVMNEAELSFFLPAGSVLVTNSLTGVDPITNFQFGVGTTTVTFTTRNSLGQAVTCTTDVTVIDDVAPVFGNCPSGGLVFNLGDGACDITVDFDLMVTDNCSGTSLGLPAGAVTTTFADNNGQDGNMFDVRNNGSQAIRLTSFVANLDAGLRNMEIYFTTTAPTYMGNEMNAGAWTLLGATTVTGLGAGQPTPVPIGGLVLAPGESRGIYVTTTNGGINYTNGPVNGNMPFTDGTLAIIADNGTGNAYPFGAVFRPRVWNGTINYEIAISPLTVVQTAGLPSGSAFPIGTTTNTFVATDGFGNSTTCTFDVIINPLQVNNNGLVVNQTVQASLDPTASCSFVTADGILEGGPYRCFDSFRITRTPAVAPGFGCPTGPVYLGQVPITCADIGRPVRVVITDPTTGNSQWSTIIVEDKTAPVLTGCDDITLPCNFPNTATAGVQTFSVAPAVAILDNSTVEAILPVNLPAGASILDVNTSIDITHTWIGDLTISIISPTGTEVLLWDGYCGPTDNWRVDFDDEAPNCSIACADYTSGMLLQPPACDGFDPALDFLSDFDFGSPNGNWRLRVTDDSGGDVGTIDSFSLTIQFASAIGAPGAGVQATDNCPGVQLTSTTSTTNGNCGVDRAVVRTYIATDASGNTSVCTQRITFERPDLAAITFPTSLDGISGPMLDCTSAFPAIGARVTLNDTALITPGTAIADGATVQIPITLSGFPSDAQFTDLNIGVGIDYTAPQQLIATFGRQFDPNTVTLFETPCDPNGVAGVDDVIATFDDSGAAFFDCAGFAPVIQGTYQPVEPLAQFNGQSVNGTYILYLQDFFADPFNPDFGALDSLRLTFSYSTATAITVPTIGGLPITQLACQLNITTDERVIDVCPESYKVRRVFTVLDMCTGEERVSTQIIAVMDQEGPILAAPRSTLANQIDLIAISTQRNTNQISGYGPCLGDVTVPPVAIVGDDCSGVVSVSTEIYSADSTLLAATATNGGLFTGLPLMDGIFVSALREPDITYRVRYLVEDACGNQTDAEVFYNVIERTAPVADCDEITNVSITGTDTTFVPASVFDDGSYDVCGDVFFYARRMQPLRDQVPYGNYFESDNLKTFVPFKFRENVAFTCSDQTVMVYFLVVDEFVQGYIDFTVNVTIPGLPAATRNNPNTPYTIRPDGTFFLSTANAIGGRTKDIWEGHYNLCMVEVRVEDKIAPVLLTSVPNQTLSCTQLGLVQQYANPANLTFDAPTFQDNCAFDVTLVVNDGTGNCGAGVITRTFTATDANSNRSVTFTQRITVLLEHDYTILFPDDLDIRNCLFGVGTNDTLTEDRLIERDCDLLAVSHTDQLFTADDDACYKILRTYDVINWCEWNGVDAAINITNPSFTTAGPRLDVTVSTAGVDVVRINGQLQPFGSVGRFSYVQIIKVYDTVDPTLTNISQVACTPASVVAINPTTCGQAVAVSFDLSDNCADEFNVSYRLVAFAGPGTNPVTGLPVRAVTPADLAAAVAAGTSFPNDPFGGTIAGRTRNAQGVFVNVPAGTVTIQGSFPLGNHILVITVNDQCGNLIEAYVPFTARDCKAPTVKLLNGLAINNMQTGTITVTARMFDAGSSDACSAVRLSYSPNVNDTARTFTCADLGTTTVRIYGTDAAGNQDFVDTYIIIQDQTGVCSGTSPRIAARLTTDGGNGVAGATVKVSGDAQMTATSDVNGAADFAVVAGGDYSVSAEHRANPANGVSTFDIAMVGRHVLGTSPLTTFSELTAADASGNGTISAYDMTVIRRVVLGLDAEFRGSPSWRFFNAGDYSLEVFNVNDAAGVTPAEFLAVKIGDVSGNARANARQALAPRTLTGEFALVAADARLGAGETHTVVFGASDLNVAGYQLTLEWDPTAVSVEGVEALTHDAEGFGTHLLADGKLTLSYAGEMSEELFGLKVRALRAGVVLSEAFQVTSAVTTAEAYGADAGLQSVTLRFGGATAATGYALEQNRPNPFANTTVIGFTMGETADATLVVTDIAGRVVWRVGGVYDAGHNVVEIAGDELPKGVLNYTLTAGDYTATRKMIKID